MLRASTCLVAVCLTTVSRAQDANAYWPQWRGPLATGVAPHADPPIEWSEDQNVRWKLPLSGAGHGTPVVWGEQLFLTAAIPFGEPFEPRVADVEGAHDNLAVTSAHKFAVLAVDRGNGEVLWESTVHEAIPHEGGHDTGTFASASPVTDGERVIAFFGSYGIHALGLDGELQWQVQLGPMQTKHAHGEGASPVLHGDTLVVNWDHEGPSFLVALDTASGEERWRVQRNEVTSWSTPIVVEVDGKPQVIVAGTKAVRGYALEDGSVIWECGGMPHNIVASPVAADGVVYAAGSYEKQALLALRLSGASGDLSRSENLLWMRRHSTPYVPSPLLYGDALYFLHHYQGSMSRVERASGEEPTGPFRLGLGNVYASPIGAAGRVYITARDGTTLVLEHAKEPKPLARNVLDDSFSASAVAVDRELYLRGERFLYCLAEGGGEPEGGR